MKEKHWKERLTQTLEPLLKEKDPRPHISAYHDMPYAIFWYPPKEELNLRAELLMLKTRLDAAGKEVLSISLAECMTKALEAEDLGTEALVEDERTVGLETTVETVHQVLAEYQPLDGLVAARIPDDADPEKHIVFATRAGALFPFYRTSSLLDQLMGKVHLPSILFYPGDLEEPAGLKFMGVLDAEHNYRARIF